MKSLRLRINNQRGFTFIELLIALAITGLIASALTMTIYQVITVPIQSSNHMTAVKQVESAIHWLNRDVQQAQILEVGEDAGFPLSLTWVEWDNTVHQITYTIEDGELERAHSIDGAEPTRSIVALCIESDPLQTNCQFNDVDGVLTFRITASITGFKPSTETRVGEIKSRSAS